MESHQAYDELAQCSRELWNIGSIRGLVSWDQQVNMPPKGVAHRAEMLSYLAQEMHRKSTDPRIGELLAEAEQGQWTPGHAANLREWRRAYDQASKLPADLVAAPRRADGQGERDLAGGAGQERFPALCALPGRAGRDQPRDRRSPGLAGGTV